MNHMVGFSLSLKDMLVVGGFSAMVTLFKGAAQGDGMREKSCGSVALGDCPGTPVCCRFACSWCGLTQECWVVFQLWME